MSAPEFPEAAEATREESIKTACDYIERALKELREDDTSHAGVWLESAMIWIPRRKR